MKPRLSTPPPPPPPQPELKNKGLQEDEADQANAAVTKRRETRTGLRAAYLNAPSPGVNLQ